MHLSSSKLFSKLGSERTVMQRVDGMTDVCETIGERIAEPTRSDRTVEKRVAGLIGWCKSIAKDCSMEQDCRKK